ncbi:VOC family protein [Fructilactobacillus myrtifloralis]|uniref:VOC family protein n=1 Tax=Fructilactobacillus myrtifloralis TaxID=2940301 RepID=A0ABY5BTM0_9LACO|nr:VOC family protein [Fructilactobacillus myrtifloralis]USS85704.1 VOC family protein [Fructilactobacillus myrtifloralis]
MRVRDVDQVVVTVDELEAALRFYHEVLDLPLLKETADQLLFQLGKQTLVCQLPSISGLTAAQPTAGSTAFSILAKDSLATIQAHLANYFIDIVAGPIERQTAKHQVRSLFIQDPAGNLLEIKEYQSN